MDKMSIKLEELGEAIMEDPRRIVFMAAKQSQEADAALQQKIVDFNETRGQLMAQSGDNPEESTRLGDALAKLYEEIMNHPLMEGLVKAQEGMNELTAQLNNRIHFFVTGEEPMGCSGDCSGCGGSCPS